MCIGGCEQETLTESRVWGGAGDQRGAEIDEKESSLVNGERRFRSMVEISRRSDRRFRLHLIAGRCNGGVKAMKEYEDYWMSE